MGRVVLNQKIPALLPCQSLWVAGSLCIFLGDNRDDIYMFIRWHKVPLLYSSVIWAMWVAVWYSERAGHSMGAGYISVLF